MVGKLKNKIKEVIKWDYLTESGSYDEANFSKAMIELGKVKPEILKSKRSVGKRLDRDKFGPAIGKIEDAYNYFNYEVNQYGDPNLRYITEYNNFQGGTPLRWKPFKPCISSVRFNLLKRNLYLYPDTVGNVRHRKKFIEYLIKEGFDINPSSGYDGISVDNVAFTCSTSQAYAHIIKLIARPEDVILLTGPNYGLFAIESERYNARVEILDLKEEDDFYVNSKDLENKIDEINKKLVKKFKNKLDYTPRVVAFLNMNPHNPIGKVMGNENKHLLEAIGDVCLEKGVFVIDDLIYRDLNFNPNNIALPMAKYKKYFNNTISLFGISKAYGLASFRSGVVFGPKPILRGLNDSLYQQLVSMPVLQVSAASGAFNGSKSRYRKYNRYFSKLIPAYKYRYQLFEALVLGIDSVKNNKLRSKITKDIKKYIKDEKELKYVLAGIPGVNVRKNTVPDSGFFTIIDFTKLKGKKYGNETIKDDYTMLKYIYSKTKLKYIMGISMAWPYEDEIVARINFVIDKDKMIINMKNMNKVIRELK